MPATYTSTSDPIDVAWVPGLPTSGALGTTFAPGKCGLGQLSGVVSERDLEADLARLRDHHGAGVLVSLMEPFEYVLLCVPDLLDRARAHGLAVHHFPIPDMSVPRPDEGDAFAHLIGDLRAALDAGRRVVVHCRGGIGRSGLVAASVVTTFGHAPDDAIAIVRRANPGALERLAQEAYVARFAARFAARTPADGTAHGASPAPASGGPTPRRP